MTTNTKNQVLEVIYKSNGFEVYKDISEQNLYYNESLLNEFNDSLYNALYHLAFKDSVENTSSSFGFLYDISLCFLETITHDSSIELSRKPKPFNDEIYQNLVVKVPFVNGIEFITYEYLDDIWNNLSNVFIEEIKTKESIKEYLKEKKKDLFIVGRIYFHLVENKNDDQYPFAFMATYSSIVDDKIKNIPLKNAFIEYKDDYKKLVELLSVINNVKESSKLIKSLEESNDLFYPTKFTKEEAYTFLTEIKLYEEHGILCRIPNFWKRKYKSKVKVEVNDIRTTLGINSFLDFNLDIYYNDLQMTKKELEELLTMSEGLSFIKGKWVEVNHEKLKELLNSVNKFNKDYSLLDIVKEELGINENDNIIEISNKDFLLNKIVNLSKNNVPIDKLDTFVGSLRKYQKEGLDYLKTMYDLNLGCLLADDMGLGKTIQVLALLEYLRINKKTKTLLIVPASLIYNWQKEASKFTPLLNVSIINSQNKEDLNKESDLYIITYAMASRLDLSNNYFDLLILDEAQAIKNTETKQAKAIKNIKGNYKMCLTGTPIENRLLDMWSLFDFMNKGLLGSKTEFSRFAKSMKDNSYQRLKGIVSPFIKRRVKTDKNIINDLPDKIENKVYVSLSKRQIVLYNQIIEDLKKSVEKTEGIKRQGLILQTILKCKQLCNHPSHYLSSGSYEPSLSGKFEALAEIVSVIKEKRERVLIFTQFKEIIQPLFDYLEGIFNQGGLIIHGGIDSKKRIEIVEEFNSDKYVPFMILSLKAGGVGLNLTKANHVIHFDRWWNPAIENQATDRAFRIGQTKNVFIHKFITKNTIEEKIDQMIEEKLELANEIITSNNENWITNMSNEQLLKLFRFGD